MKDQYNLVYIYFWIHYSAHDINVAVVFYGKYKRTIGNKFDSMNVQIYKYG